MWGAPSRSFRGEDRTPSARCCQPAGASGTVDASRARYERVPRVPGGRRRCGRTCGQSRGGPPRRQSPDVTDGCRGARRPLPSDRPVSAEAARGSRPTGRGLGTRRLRVEADPSTSRRVTEGCGTADGPPPSGRRVSPRAAVAARVAAATHQRRVLPRVRTYVRTRTVGPARAIGRSGSPDRDHLSRQLGIPVPACGLAAPLV